MVGLKIGRTVKWKGLKSQGPLYCHFLMSVKKCQQTQSSFPAIEHVVRTPSLGWTPILAANSRKFPKKCWKNFGVRKQCHIIKMGSAGHHLFFVDESEWLLCKWSICHKFAGISKCTFLSLCVQYPLFIILAVIKEHMPVLVKTNFLWFW